MNIEKFLKHLIIAGVIGLWGCGGGGGGGTTSPTTPAPVAKTTTISGKAEFPSISLSSLVAKQVAGALPDSSVSVQAFTLEGVAIGTPVTPTYDDTVPGSATDYAKRIYSYTLSDIPIGKDYIVRAKRSDNGKSQELKKLIEKSDVGETPLVNQSLDSVSTTAVVIASQKLATAMGISATINLGEPLPSLGSKTVTDLSAAIVTDVAPKALETSIQGAKTTLINALASGDLATALASMTTEEKKAMVNLVNMLNVVVAAVANSTDSAQLLAGTASVQLATGTTDKQLKFINVDENGTVAQGAATTTISGPIINDFLDLAVITYVPPRVTLEFSSDSTSLYGFVIELTIPADATVRADASGKLDTTQINAAAGVSLDGQYTPSTRKLRIAAASGSAPMPATPFTLRFDRTAGKVLSSADFTSAIKETSDANGAPIASGFNLRMKVTSSGS